MRNSKVIQRSVKNIESEYAKKVRMAKRAHEELNKAHMKTGFDGGSYEQIDNEVSSVFGDDFLKSVREQRRLDENNKHLNSIPFESLPPNMQDQLMNESDAKRISRLEDKLEEIKAKHYMLNGKTKDMRSEIIKTVCDMNEFSKEDIKDALENINMEHVFSSNLEEFDRYQYGGGSI